MKYLFFRIALGAVAFGSLQAVTLERRHLTLKRSEPGKFDTIAVAPKAIRLWFSQKVELKLSTVTMADAHGAAVTLGPLTRSDSVDAPVVTIVKGTLAAGTFTVSWRAPADDGHPSSGKFDFVLRATP